MKKTRLAKALLFCAFVSLVVGLACSEATGPVEQPLPEEPNVILEFSGQGNEATRQFHLDSGLVRFNYRHDGEHFFAIWLLDSQGNKAAPSVAAEIGACEGSSADSIRAGNYLLDVTADGNWTVVVEQ